MLSGVYVEICVVREQEVTDWYYNFSPYYLAGLHLLNNNAFPSQSTSKR